MLIYLYIFSIQDEPKMDIFFGPKEVRLRTVAQGLLGGLLLAAMFSAVKIVPLGNASAIMFCTPIFTFLLAPFMLRERYFIMFIVFVI